MGVQRTLSIVKPDAVSKNVVGEIYSRFEKAGLRIGAAKMLRLSCEQAEGFYAEHKGRPFFPALVGSVFPTPPGGALLLSPTYLVPLVLSPSV